VTVEVPPATKRCLKCQRTYPVTARVCADDGEPLSLPDPYQLVSHTLAERYRLDALVGLGGMGAVYSAWHLAIDRRVAVKILQPNIAVLDARMVALFEREARTVGRLVHENIANVFDAGRTGDGIAYIAMEWVSGCSLEEDLAAGGAMNLDRAAELIRQMAAALDAAHAAHIVHRDLKPGNVMLAVTPDGRERVKVVDFGIAKAITDITQTARSIVTGTPLYASPEQLAGADIDARSDIYSLGVIVYRMLTGVLPFEGASLDELVRQKSVAALVRIRELRPGIPLAIEQLIHRMLARNPDDRPARASDVARVFAYAVAFPGSRELDATWPVADATSSATAWTTDTPTLLPKRTPSGSAVSSRDIDEANPLLSEFESLPEWLRTKVTSGRLALGFVAGAVAAIVLSHVVGAACIRVSLVGSPAAERTLLFGYVAEPNAAFWYLLGVPIFVVMGVHFLRLAHSTLRELSVGERLVAGGGGSPIALIADRNRRWFRVLTPMVLVLSFAAVYIPEFVAGPGPAFGWVGALAVKDYEGVTVRQLQNQGRIGTIPAIESLCANTASGCDVRVARIDGGHGRNDRERWTFLFTVFLLAALGLQVLFGAFAGWVAAKTLFMFGVLTYALIDRSGRGLKIDLDFGDSEMRFGLGALDVVHNIVLLLTLTASVVFLLQRMANVVKGNSVFGGMAGEPLLGQLAVFVVSVLPLLLTVFAPMAVFMILVETEVGHAIESVERERVALRKSLGGSTPPHQRAAMARAEEHLRRRRDLVRRQRPWPRKNTPYRLLLAASVIMLVVLPFAIEYSGISGGLTILSRSAANLSEILCRIL